MSGLESQIRRDFSSEHAFTSIEKLVSLGQRVCGTEEEHRAAEWIASQFSELGLEVSLEPFNVVSWRCDEIDLEVIDPQERKLRAVAFGYSPSTPAGGLRSEVVFVGRGLDSDYCGKNVSGKIVLADWCDIWYAHQYWVAVKNGASGFLLAYSEPGYLRAEALAYNGQPPPIPCALTTFDDRQFMIKQMEKGSVEVELKLKTEIDLNATSYNVVGKITGSKWPKQQVVICGHIDNWFYGANDNAGSIAALIEIARVLSKRRSKRTLTFLATASEEAGSLDWFYYLQGSDAYVRQHPEDVRNTVAVLNGEFLGRGEKLNVEATPELLGFMKETAEDLGIVSKLGDKAVFRGPPDDWEDGFTFAIAGVPTSCIWWMPYAEYHTTEDTPDKIELDKLATSIEFIGVAGYRISNMDLLPYNFVDYGELMLNGNQDRGMLELLSPEWGYRSAKGLIELSNEAEGIVSFRDCIGEAKSFLEYARKAEDMIRSTGGDKANIVNEKMLSICHELHPITIGAGGNYALNELYLYTLRPVDDLVGLKKALDSLRGIRGSMIDNHLKVYISFLGQKVFYVDLYDDIRSLERKMEFLRKHLQREAQRLSKNLNLASRQLSELITILS